MTDALPRLDRAFDAVSTHALDRRQLLRAGAWAAPALVLATAAPAAANTSGVDATFSGAAAVGNTFAIYNENVPGRGKAKIAIRYDRNAFPQGQNVGNNWVSLAVPAQITVAWQLVAKGPGNSPGETVLVTGVSSAAPYEQSPEQTYEFTMGRGRYTFELRATSVKFSLNPVTQPDGSLAYFTDTVTTPLSTETQTIT